MSWILGLLLIAVQEGDRPQPKVERCSTGQDVLLVGGQFLDRSTGVVLGGDLEEGPAALFRTTDGGSTWRSVAPEVAARLYDVHFPEAREGWAVGLAGTVLRTTDRGATWKRVAFPEEAWLASVWFVSPSHGWVAGGGPDGMLLFETRDAGATWKDARDRVPSELRNKSLRDLCFLDDRNGWCAGSAGLLLRTQDGGVHWQAVEVDTGAWLRAMAFRDDLHGLVVGANGRILETRDGGDTFARVPFDSSVKFNDVAFDAHDGAWLASMDGRLLWRAAGEEEFQEILREEVPLTKLAFPADRVGYVAGGAGYVGRIQLPGDKHP